MFYILHALAGDRTSVTACQRKAHSAVKKCEVELVIWDGGKVSAVESNLQLMAAKDEPGVSQPSLYCTEFFECFAAIINLAYIPRRLGIANTQSRFQL